MQARLQESVLEQADLNGGDGECAICLDDQKVGDLAVRLGCGHFFHKRCIEPWVKRSAICPNCRVPISSGTKSSNFAQRKNAKRDRHDEQVQAMARAMREMEEEERRAREKKNASDLKKNASDLKTSSNDPERSKKGMAQSAKEKSQKDAKSTTQKEPAPSAEEESSEFRNLPVSVLKSRLAELGVGTDGVVEKRDLISLLERSCDEESFKTLGVRELKRRLKSLCIKDDHAIMKSELVKLLTDAVKKKILIWKSMPAEAKSMERKCEICRSVFSEQKRKRQCRYCGSHVCSSCSKSDFGDEGDAHARSHKYKTEELGVCNNCARKLWAHYEEKKSSSRSTSIPFETHMPEFKKNEAKTKHRNNKKQGQKMKKKNKCVIS